MDKKERNSMANSLVGQTQMSVSYDNSTKRKDSKNFVSGVDKVFRNIQGFFFVLAIIEKNSLQYALFKPNDCLVRKFILSCLTHVFPKKL